MPLANLNDLKVTFDHDLMIQGGDLATTENDAKLAILQYIRYKLTITKDGSQTSHFEDQYVGKTNTRELGNDMALELRLLLTEDGLINPNEITITPFPIDRHTIGFKISLAFFDEININNNTILPKNISELVTFVAFNNADGALYNLK